jgi:hypothetical protein
MTTIVSTSSVGAGKIGYHNLFEDSTATVAASTEATGYLKENAYDGLGYDWWKPTATGDSYLSASFGSAQTANYMTIWGHDFGTNGSSAKPQYSTNGGSTWNDAASSQSPTHNNTLFWSWDDISAADWRCLVTNPSGISVIAGVQIGQVLALPYNMSEGFAPPSLAPMVTLKTSQSESGAFIGGRVLNKGIIGKIDMSDLDPAWVRTYWVPFITHAQTPKVFVVAWDDQNHSSEVVLGWVKKQVPQPKYNTPLLMNISLDFEGNL